jgi:quinol monooxygenase YgiN
MSISVDEARISVTLLWATEDADAQAALIAAMQGDVPWMSSQPGFVSLALRPSRDGRRVVVEGEWENQAQFDAATANNPHEDESRRAFAAHGRLDEVILTRTAAHYGPNTKG